VEVEVAQQNRDLTSLPPRERVDAMPTIVAKTKDNTTARDEQQSISQVITSAANKALKLFTQLSDVQVVD
jgi:hypothetical protein